MLKHKGKREFTYSTKTDVWGMGMLFAEVLTLDYAFDADSEHERINSIAKVKNLRPIPEQYPLIFKELTLGML